MEFRNKDPELTQDTPLTEDQLLDKLSMLEEARSRYDEPFFKQILTAVNEYPKLKTIEQSYEDLRIICNTLTEEGTKLKEDFEAMRRGADLWREKYHTLKVDNEELKKTLINFYDFEKLNNNPNIAKITLTYNEINQLLQLKQKVEEIDWDFVESSNSLTDDKLKKLQQFLKGGSI